MFNWKVGFCRSQKSVLVMMWRLCIRQLACSPSVRKRVCILPTSMCQTSGKQKTPWARLCLHKVMMTLYFQQTLR